MGIIFQQFEELVSVLIFKGVTARFTQWNVHRQDNQVVLWHKSKGVFNEFQLVLPESAPITLTISWIGIKYIIQDNKMNFPVVKGEIGRAEMSFKCFVGEFVFLHVKIEIMVTQYIIPR